MSSPTPLCDLCGRNTTSKPMSWGGCYLCNLDIPTPRASKLAIGFHRLRPTRKYGSAVRGYGHKRDYGLVVVGLLAMSCVLPYMVDMSYSVSLVVYGLLLVVCSSLCFLSLR